MTNVKSLLAVATDPSLKEPDLATTFDIVEEIQRKKGNAKDAVAAIRRNLLTGESTTQCHTIEVLDACMKNCGEDFYAEVFTKSFMDALKTVVTESGNDKLINRTLELLSQWNAGLSSIKGHGLVKDACSELQKEGIFFPEVEAPKASFLEKAPEWVKGERCFYCRDEFSKISLSKGRHHCRNCGNSVCGSCSTQTTPLPHFNMPKPQRVCDKCYRKVKPGAPTANSSTNDDDAMLEEYMHSSLAKEAQKPPSTHDTELQEQEELEMAMAISLSTQDQPKPSLQPIRTVAPVQASDDPPMYRDIPSAPSYEPIPEPEYTNPQLNAYMDRGRWEQQHKAQQQQQLKQNDVGPAVTAVPSIQTSSTSTGSPLADAMKKTIETFLQRMEAVSVAGKSIAADASVQTMFESLTVMHPQLLAQLEALQERKGSEEGVLRKVDEVKEARVSLNAMRRQHLEKVRQQEEEQSLLARMQMEQKLALLRQQKNEQLTFQRELEKQRRDELEDQEAHRLQVMQEQLEMERSRLKVQEQQLIQQQFGSYVVPAMQQVNMTDYHLPSVPQAPRVEPVSNIPDLYINPTTGYTSLPGSGYSYQNPSLAAGANPSLGVQPNVPPSYSPPQPSMLQPHAPLPLSSLNPQPVSLPPPPPSHVQIPVAHLNPQPSSLPSHNLNPHGITPDPVSYAPTMINPPSYQPAVAPTPLMNYSNQPPISTAYSTGYLGGPTDMQYVQPPPQHQVPPMYTVAPPGVYGAPPNNQHQPAAIQEAELISFD